MSEAAPLQEITPGTMPASSLFDEHGHLLHCFGFPLTAPVLDRLGRNGVSSIALYEGAIPEDVHGRIKEVVSRAVQNTVALTPPTAPEMPAVLFTDDALKQMLERNSIWRGLDQSSEMVSQILDPLKRTLEECKSVLFALPEDLLGERQVTHLLETAIFSLALGLAFEYGERDLRQLAAAALLHDIGLFLFPQLDGSPPDQLDGFYAELMREHPAMSAMILRGSRPGLEMIERTILQHHEAFDGTGYPLKLRGMNTEPGVLRKVEIGQIDPAAEILSVANTFSAVTDPGGIHKLDELAAITHLVQQSETRFNPFVVQELCSLVQRFPVGAPVQILSTSSGRYVGFTGVVREVGALEDRNPIKSMLITRNAKGQQVTPVQVEFKEEKRVHLRLSEVM
jgi:HD-GYP domain-containing protein (c-di-GMP phosphodiesterase class II)